MNPLLVKEEFKGRICEQIDLEQEGENRFRVVTPFRFDDGDQYSIYLKRERDSWILTDEASTLMHLSYWLDEKDLESGNRNEIIEGSLSAFMVQNREGELLIPVKEERFGDALFNFVQALSKVTDVSFLSREVVRSTFLEDFRAFIRAQVQDERRLSFDWTDNRRDPKGMYPVDCRINGIPRPLFVYALPGEAKVRDATIYLLTFEQWQIPFQSLAIFEEQEKINPRVLARFTDVCEKTFSSLEENKERIATHLKRVLITGSLPLAPRDVT